MEEQTTHGLAPAALMSSRSRRAETRQTHSTFDSIFYAFSAVLTLRLTGAPSRSQLGLDQIGYFTGALNHCQTHHKESTQRCE